jgi:hypothetical protein
VELFQQDHLDAVASVRQPLEVYAREHADVRILPGRFMVIEQAVALPKGRPEAEAYLRQFVEEMKASGFVANALAQYTIHSTVFRSWFADRRQLRLALDWLERRRRLRPKVTEKALDKTSLDWAEQTPKWPNGRSVRSIVFLGPETPPKTAA